MLYWNSFDTNIKKKFFSVNLAKRKNTINVHFCTYKISNTNEITNPDIKLD